MTEKFILTLHVNVAALKAEFEFLREPDRVQKNITFLDEQKNKQQGKLSSADGNHLFCFWDRHPFDWKGLPCPLRKEYEPKTVTYESGVNGFKYMIPDSLNEQGALRCVDYFCSGECCLAYIEENAADPRFVDSKVLLFEMLGKSCKPAPSFRLLTPYGGSLSIDQFRGQFCNKHFTLEGILTKPVYYLYKENYRLN